MSTREMRSASPADAPAVLPSAAKLVIPDDNRILYYGRDRVLFRFLSHFWPAAFVLDNESWPTVEHFYQAQKSDDPDYRAAVRAAVSPGLAKRLAARPQAPRRISRDSWFKRNGKEPRADWHEVKLTIMRRATGPNTIRTRRLRRCLSRPARPSWSKIRRRSRSGAPGRTGWD